MVLIEKLINSDIDYTVIKAYYTEGPIHFDEWYHQ